MDVLPREHERFGLRDRLKTGAYGTEDGVANALCVVEVITLGRGEPVRGLDAEQPREQHDAPRYLLGAVAVTGQQGLEPRRELCPRDLGGVVVHDPALVAQHFAERPVDDARAEWQAPAPAHARGRVLRGERALELAQQPGLAHARLAEHRDKVGEVIARDPCEQHLQGGELVLPSDQRGFAAQSASAAGALLQQADRLPGRHGLGLSLELERLELQVLDAAARCPPRALADGDRAWAGARLQARGDVDGVSDDRVGVADLAGQHLAGVDAHAQRELEAVVGEQPPVQLLHRSNT